MNDRTDPVPSPHLPSQLPQSQTPVRPSFRLHLTPPPPPQPPPPQPPTSHISTQSSSSPPPSSPPCPPPHHQHYPAPLPPPPVVTPSPTPHLPPQQLHGAPVPPPPLHNILTTLPQNLSFPTLRSQLRSRVVDLRGQRGVHRAREFQ